MKTNNRPSLRSLMFWIAEQSQMHIGEPSKIIRKSPYHPGSFQPLVLMLLAFGFTNSFGQTPGNTIFGRPTLSQLQQQSRTPQQQPYQPAPYEVLKPNRNHNPIVGNNQIERQNAIIPQQRAGNQQSEYNAIKQELKEDEIKVTNEKRNQQSQIFQSKLQQFLNLNPDSFSIAKAIYLSESAWYDRPPTFEQFNNAIKARANLAKTIMHQEKLNPKNNTAINYAIQKLYTQDNKFYNPKTKKWVTVPRIRYDFNDPMGEEDYAQLFVTKLLQTGTGQCHNMPLHYLCLAQELGAKAYLSLSPQHSFIQYFDEHNYRYNFETTNGNLVTQTWLMQSNFVNATALKNKTYLDTLSNKQLYAQLLGDLLNVYVYKIGYDNNSDNITGQILKIDPNNLTALISSSNLNTYIATEKLKKAGNPPVAQIPNFPEANAAYQKMLQGYDRIDQTGFQDMPKDEYQRWLKSVDEEKKKEENKKVQQRVKAEIEMLKKLKMKFINKPKG